MTCPPEIASILLHMMTIGFVRIRNLADESGRCQVIADHLHNLPELVRDFSPARLLYYWDAERSCFLSRCVEEDRKAFEPSWEALRPVVELMKDGRRIGYFVVIERAEDGTWHAFAPDLPGCVSSADLPWEAANEIRDAMLWHIASLRRHNEPIPPPSATGHFVMIDLP